MNSRHLAPKASALPDCATPRKGSIIAVTGIAGQFALRDKTCTGLFRESSKHADRLRDCVIALSRLDRLLHATVQMVLE